MKRLWILVIITFIGFSVQAQSGTLRTVEIQTNGVSEKCKNIMMENVPQWKGVKQCSYDMKTSKLTVVYDSSKTNPDAIRQGIGKLGFNADSVKADAAARDKLPSCCKQTKKNSGCGGCPHQGCGSH